MNTSAPPEPADLPAQVERVVHYFQTLSPASLAQLGDFYSDDAYFKDPYNEVCGRAQIERVFAHMFDTLEAPRFVIIDRVYGTDEHGLGQCFLSWDFHFRFRQWRPAQAQQIHGSSHLRLHTDGRIRYHRDYWDSSEEVYEKLPLLGPLMRWIKRRARA